MLIWWTMASSIFYYNNTFIFQKYQHGLQLGIGNDTDHNSVLDDKVNTLTEAIIPSHVQNKPVIRFSYKALRNIPNLEIAFIPRTVREIRGDTFLRCYKLTTVVFEENSEIEFFTWYIFYETNISTITFPSSAAFIDYKSFYKCKNLKNVIILGFLHSNATDLFEGAAENISIYVPSNYPWNEFGGRSVIKIMPEYVKRRYTTMIPAQMNLPHITFFTVLTLIYL